MSCEWICVNSASGGYSRGCERSQVPTVTPSTDYWSQDPTTVVLGSEQYQQWTRDAVEDNSTSCRYELVSYYLNIVFFKVKSLECSHILQQLLTVSYLVDTQAEALHSLSDWVKTTTGGGSPLSADSTGINSTHCNKIVTFRRWICDHCRSIILDQVIISTCKKPASWNKCTVVYSRPSD